MKKTKRQMADFFQLKSMSGAHGQRGVALLMTLFFVIFMSFLASNISYETIVEYNVSSQKVNRLKAYYAAKAGVEISLLRVLIYEKALSSLPPSLKINPSLLEPIWKLPLGWPPSSFLGEGSGITLAILGQIKSSEKDSFMEAQYLTTIESEDHLLDINDLASPSKSLREATAKQLLNIFQAKAESNESFREKYTYDDFKKLVDNIIDWVNEGRDKTDLYADVNIKENDFNRAYIPPNQPFKNLEELHMVSGMNQEFFDLLKPQITLFGSKAVNINYASPEFLKTLGSVMTDEVVEEIISRRGDSEQGGGFESKKEFFEFLSSFGIDPEDIDGSSVRLSFGRVFNFRIKSLGSYNRSEKEIEVVTYNYDRIKETLVKILEEDDKDSSSPTTLPQSQKKKKLKVPKGRPIIVLWKEN